MSIEAKTVLIVDDMKTVRLKLRKLCTELGINRIHEAMDGAEALQIMATIKFDLVLSDWNMPNMTGLELVGKMRQNANLANTPVIFITAENEKGAILKSLMSGVTDYIVKPFPDVTVKQKICGALKVQGKG